MTALRKTQIALDPDAAPFAIRAERASDVVAREGLVPALGGQPMRAPASACATDARPPKALRFRSWPRAGWSGRCGCGTSVLAGGRRAGPGRRVVERSIPPALAFQA